MLSKTKGIVLHTIKYGETSIIAHIYTEQFGRQSYMVNGVRSKRSKVAFSHFQPLTMLQLQTDHKPTRNIQRIRELKLHHAAHSIQADVVKNSIALFLGEVLYRCLKEEEPNKTLFHYLENTIQLLDLAQKGAVNFHLIFLVQFTRFLGIFPEKTAELDNYQPTDLDISLHDLVGITLKDVGQIQMNTKTRNSLLKSIMDYYYYHLEGMGKVNSLEVLQDVFS